MLARRREVSARERARARDLVARVVAASEVFARSRQVVLYAPIASELATAAIEAEALGAGKELLWPRVRASGQIEVARAERLELTPDAVGVPAPPLDRPGCVVLQARLQVERRAEFQHAADGFG